MPSPPLPAFTTGTTFIRQRIIHPGFDQSGERRHRVSVTSPVTFTMSNLIDAASVNPQTVEVCFHATTVRYVAGSYSVSGASVTFTPLTQYPANTVMGMYVNGLTDEAGNPAYCQCGTFTTANTADNTPPTVTISPANGTTNVGLNTQIVLTFSKSINPSTITSNTLALFNGDTAIDYGYSISRDNRTIVLNPMAPRRRRRDHHCRTQQRHSGFIGQLSGKHQQPVHFDARSSRAPHPRGRRCVPATAQPMSPQTRW